MKKNILFIVTILLLALLLGMWIFQGCEIYTKDKRQIVTKTKDEIFETETVKIEWVDDFRLGLLPGGESLGSIFICVAVPGVLLCALAIITITSKSRKQSK